METNTQTTEKKEEIRLGAVHISEEDVRVVREQVNDNRVRVKRVA